MQKLNNTEGRNLSTADSLCTKQGNVGLKSAAYDGARTVFFFKDDSN